MRLLTQVTRDHRVDVALLCETWVTEQTKKLINIPGYQFVGMECTVKKGGSVGILVANNLKFKIRPDYNNMSDHLESNY